MEKRHLCVCMWVYVYTCALCKRVKDISPLKLKNHRAQFCNFTDKETGPNWIRLPLACKQLLGGWTGASDLRGSCFFFKFIFNWRIITLQYCVGFCHTSTWISHRYTHVPFEPPSHAHFLMTLRHRSRGRHRMRWLYGITDSVDMSLNNSGR